ncbi:MAG: FAD-dependent oxidoreductase [Candidatus Omnitrophota bacterium]|nr:FAD-dependent oxidoreductase [Candidatus Omnitrophota bacterium]
MKVYDLIIIGAGPAGITAAVYAARKQMSILVISPDIGGQAAWSGDIENYTGYQFISGPDLAAKFEEHMRKYNIELKEGEMVIDLKKLVETALIKTGKGEYQAKAVIVASGKRSRELGAPGEKEFKNKGLTYCATCDGPLFSGKEVAIVGGGNSALDAALQMVKIAKKVYVVNNTPRLGGDPVMREKVEGNPIVTVFNESRVTAVLGDKFVNAIKIAVSGEERTVNVQGIFVEIGLIPNTDFAKELAKNERGEIKVNSRNETNIPGIFAAGDVTDVPEKQIIIAAGEGSKACLSAFRYLSEH